MNAHTAMVNRQPDVGGIVVVGSEVSYPFRTELTSGEVLLLIAGGHGWDAKESVKCHIRRIEGILRPLLQKFDNGQSQKRPAESFLWESYGRVINPTAGIPLSLRAPQGSTGLGWLNDTSASSATPCSTRVSDTSTQYKRAVSHADSPTLQVPLRQPVRSPITSAASTTATQAPPPRHEAPEPLVLASVRQVLAKNPLYAEKVVLCLKSLPTAKREILFCQYQTPAEDYAPLQDSPRQVPQGRPSQAKCGKRQSETHRVQKPFGDKPKKKAKLPDDGDNQGDGDDGSGSNGGGATFTVTDAQKKSNCRWACPYCLVFAQMLTIAKFQSCRPPGYLKDRSLWRNHLKEYHSPEATIPNYDVYHSLFYMTIDQWDEVKARIDQERSSRPRSYDKWFEAQKQCFLDVWRIIFPRDRYPGLREPISPFHPDSRSLESLSSRGVILLETILEVRASEAVNNGSISTVQDFRPTHEQYMEMMREALLVITTESPGITQWVTSVSLEGLRTAVLDHDRTSQQAEAESADSEAVISSEQTIGSAVPAVPLPTRTHLFPSGTGVSRSNALGVSRGPAPPRVAPPQLFPINSISPVGGDDASLQDGAGMASMPTDLDSPSMLTDSSDTPWLEFEDLVNYRHDTFTPPQ